MATLLSPYHTYFFNRNGVPQYLQTNRRNKNISITIDVEYVTPGYFRAF